VVDTLPLGRALQRTGADITAPAHTLVRFGGWLVGLLVARGRSYRAVAEGLVLSAARMKLDGSRDILLNWIGLADADG